MIKIPPHIRRLLAIHMPYKNRLMLAFFGMMITAATTAVLPHLLKFITNRGFTGQQTFSYWMVPLVLIGLFAIRGASTFLSSYMMTWVSARVLNELRAQMFTRLLDVPFDYYHKNTLGRTINSIMFEVQQIIEMVTKVLTSMVLSSLTIIWLLGTLFNINWKLTIVTLVLLPVNAAIVRATGARLKKLNQQSLQVNGELTQVIEETMRAQQVIKIFGGQHYEKTRFNTRSENLRRTTMKITSTFAATVPITHLMTAFALSVVVVVALNLANHGQLNAGQFYAFATAMLLLLQPLKQLAEVNGPLQRGIAAAEAVFHLIDTQSERSDGKILTTRAQGTVNFINVDFTYPEQEQTASLPALSDINLHIKAGETIAFVGMSGGGKSTLVSLLPEFYRTTKGEIRLDGQAISSISLTSLRAQIAMVSQNVVLFDDTLAANIAYGAENPDPEKILLAAKAAYLDEVIHNLPEGIHTKVGNNGSRLSGGQRQRLAIARAIYKDAPLLILDEATSALDTESERYVQAALDELMRGRTTLVIAHRLSTIERASRIVVLSSGRIVEVGTHQQLLEKDGAYANLYRLQFSKET
ncbi:MAG: lipid A export permease/ATP-binding protein MsbA [Undibacterium sp.]|nr:lipid A export permease/ATP-binding protein MsbA [Undibacterium sp.]